MFRFDFALPVLTSLVLLAPQQLPNSSAAARPAAVCPDSLPNHPVLTHDIAGSTLIGPIYRHLVVYSSGLVSLSATTYDPDPGRAQTAVLTPQEVAQLRASLVAAGAFRLCDDDSTVSDVPLTTVTVFRAANDTQAHSYSYSLPTPQQAVVEDLVNQLIASKFPNF